VIAAKKTTGNEERLGMIGIATATMPMESDTDTALSEKLQALGIFMTRYGLAVVFARIGAMKFSGYKATGYSPVVFVAMECLGKNGVLALASVTRGDREHSVPADKISLDFVLGSKLVVGTVNANREYFEVGVYDLSRAELEFPDSLTKLLTHPVTGEENYQ
jgi:hypothetical protein